MRRHKSTKAAPSDASFPSCASLSVATGLVGDKEKCSKRVAAAPALSACATRRVVNPRVHRRWSRRPVLYASARARFRGARQGRSGKGCRRQATQRFPVLLHARSGHSPSGACAAVVAGVGAYVRLGAHVGADRVSPSSPHSPLSRFCFASAGSVGWGVHHRRVTRTLS